MSRRPLATVVLALAFALICLSGTAGAADQSVARLVAFSGSVDVLRLGQPQRLYPDFALLDDDIIQTHEGLAIVRFTDRTEVRLRPHTRISLADRADKRDINVFVGRLWSFIATRKDHPTNFKTGGTIAAVRGTEIEILTNPDGSSEIGVNHGKLTIFFADGTEVTLLEGQKLAIGSDGKPGPIEVHTAGDIAAVGGTVAEVPENVPFQLTRALGVQGNFPFSPTAPLAGGEEPLSPTPTATPTTTPVTTPTVPPEGTPGPGCSSVAFSRCENNRDCCRPYLCSSTGECCRVLGTSCEIGGSDCCRDVPAVCNFSDNHRGRVVCCIPLDERCATSDDCCTGSCRNGRCRSGETPPGETPTPQPTQTATPATTPTTTPTPSPTPTVTPGPTPSPTETAPPCKSVGTVCSAPAQCCSGICVEGTCRAPCTPIGGSCTSPSQCCNGNDCPSGRCCIRDGIACLNAADCCGGVCAGGVCQQGCRANNQSCTSPAQCCSESCSGGRCCIPLGGGPARQTQQEVFNPCSSDSDCCNGICGEGGCTCAPQQFSCRSNADCCSGLCSGGSCACRGTNQPCQNSSQCCSGFCNQGTCSVGDFQQLQPQKRKKP